MWELEASTIIGRVGKLKIREVGPIVSVCIAKVVGSENFLGSLCFSQESPGSSYKLYKLAGPNHIILQQPPLAISIVYGIKEGNLQGTNPEATVNFMSTLSLHIHLSLPWESSSFCSSPFRCHISACSWQTLTRTI